MADPNLTLAIWVWPSFNDTGTVSLHRRLSTELVQSPVNSRPLPLHAGLSGRFPHPPESLLTLRSLRPPIIPILQALARYQRSRFWENPYEWETGLMRRLLKLSKGAYRYLLLSQMKPMGRTTLIPTSARKEWHQPVLSRRRKPLS